MTDLKNFLEGGSTSSGKPIEEMTFEEFKDYFTKRTEQIGVDNFKRVNTVNSSIDSMSSQEDPGNLEVRTLKIALPEELWDVVDDVYLMIALQRGLSHFQKDFEESLPPDETEKFLKTQEYLQAAVNQFKVLEAAGLDPVEACVSNGLMKVAKDFNSETATDYATKKATDLIREELRAALQKMSKDEEN